MFGRSRMRFRKPLTSARSIRQVGFRLCRLSNETVHSGWWHCHSSGWWSVNCVHVPLI